MLTKRLWRGLTKNNNYGDIYITTEKIKRISIANMPFLYQLICDRVGGWELWYKEPTGWKLQAGEYDKNWLRIDIDGYVILDSRKS